jgi:hypothetical protein
MKKKMPNNYPTEIKINTTIGASLQKETKNNSVY